MAENIALSLGGAGLSADMDTIKKSIEMVGLHHADLHKMPNELSGGMLRRASALHAGPLHRVLLHAARSTGCRSTRSATRGGSRSFSY